MNLEQMKEKSLRLIEEMRSAINEAKTATDQSRKDELNQRFERIEKDQADIDKLIQREIKLQEAEKRAIKDEIEDEPETGDASEGKQAKRNKDQDAEYRAAFGKFIKEGRSGLDSNDLKVLQRGTSTQVAGTTTLGGFTVPEGFSGELERTMKYYSGILSRARILNTATGNSIMWPTVDDTSTLATLVTEGSGTTVADVTFANKQLDAYTYRTIAKVSRELLQDSAFNLQELMTSLFAERFGRAFNAAFTNGTGSSQPNGLVTATTSGSSTAASATTFTAAELITFMHTIDPAYRNMPGVAWMFNDSVLAHIKKLTLGSGDATPLWMNNYRDGEPSTVLGKPYEINNDMDSAFTTGKKLVLFGDFSKYVVRLAGGFNVNRLEERYADELVVGFLGWQRADGELLNANAIKLLKLG